MRTLMTERELIDRLQAEYIEYLPLEERHGAKRYMVLLGLEIWQISLWPEDGEVEITVYDERLETAGPPPVLEDLFGRVGRAWQEAAQVLGITYVTPFELQGGREAAAAPLRITGWLPHFGGPRGTAIITAADPDEAREIAEAQGYFLSALNPYWYGRFDREQFIETLSDWGYYGPPEQKPAWML